MFGQSGGVGRLPGRRLEGISKARGGVALAEAEYQI
jgi:hypothetical protein